MNMPDSIAIEAKNISFGYKKNAQAILNDISFSVKKGQIIAVTSANILEINTLLLILTKKIVPDSGEVILNNVVEKHLIETEQSLCAVFSSKGFFPELSLLNNLFVGTTKAQKHYFFNKGELTRQVQMLYAEFGFNLTWFTHCQGMTIQQKNEASLIRGFLINAPLYVFDQLIDELSPSARYVFFSKCHELAKQGRTVIFSTTVAEMALNICTDMLIMRQGNIAYFSDSSLLSRGKIHCLMANNSAKTKQVINDELRYLFSETKDPENYTQQALLLLSFFFKDPVTFCVFEDSTSQILFLHTADSYPDIDNLKQAALNQFFLGETYSESFQFNNHIFHLYRFEASSGSMGVIGIQCASEENQNIAYGFILNTYVPEFSRYLSTLINEQVLKEQTKQKNRLSSLGSLAGGIVHDFNNALFAIGGSAELLLLHDNNEKQQKNINTIINVVQDTRKLTNKLLSFSRKGGSIFIVADMHDLLNDSITIASSTSNKKNNFIKEFNATQSMIECDISETRNAMVNVMTNALNAIDKKSGRIRVLTYNHVNNSGELDIEGNLLPDQSMVVSIIDNGCGIPADVLNKIFDPFFSTRLHQGGSGLGLSATYGTIKAHNGNFIVNSKLNQGTEFNIFFPLSKESFIGKKKINISLNNFQEKCILFCDDNEHVQSTFGQMLENMGVRVLLADNGAECIKVYESNKECIDLLILDEVMPVLSGSECFYQLKSNYPELQAIIVTGYHNQSQQLKLQKNGILGIYKKPLLINEVIEILNRIFR